MQSKQQIEKNLKTSKHRKRLFLGEGDFGYSTSILKKHHDKPDLGKSFIVTEKMNDTELKIRFSQIKDGEKRLKENLDFLKLQGATVCKGFDATELPKAVFELFATHKTISRIHFCCPHAGGTKTADLVKKFFESAAKIQKDGHIIHIALAGNNNKPWWQGLVYDIATAVRDNRYVCQQSMPFEQHHYDKYQHSTNNNKESPAANTIFEYVFIKDTNLSPEEIDKKNYVATATIDGKTVRYFKFPVAKSPFSSPYAESSLESQNNSMSLDLNGPINQEFENEEEEVMNQKQELEQLRKQNELMQKKIAELENNNKNELEQYQEFLQKKQQSTYKYIASNSELFANKTPDKIEQQVQEGLERRSNNINEYVSLVAMLAENEDFDAISALTDKMKSFHEKNMAELNKSMIEANKNLSVKKRKISHSVYFFNQNDNTKQKDQNYGNSNNNNNNNRKSSNDLNLRN